MNIIRFFRFRPDSIIIYAGVGVSLLLFFACETSKTLSQKRIKAVENGLLKAVVFEGEDPERMKISERMDYYQVPGVSIAVIDNSKIEWARGYGEVLRGSGESVTPETVFQAAELSQAAAAACVLSFVRDGKLNLDLPISEYLRSWNLPDSRPPGEKAISVRQILSHNSGIIPLQYEGYEQFFGLPSLDELFMVGKNGYPPVYADSLPGTQPRYSEAGYIVLEKLLEDIGRQTFAESVHLSVLEPLQMNSSSFVQPLPETLYASAASGHDRGRNPVEGKGLFYPVVSARGMWSTPSDLARLIIELVKAAMGQSQAFLQTALVREMLSYQCGNRGLGFLIGGRDDDLHFFLQGRSRGFTCFLAAYPVRGQGAVIMTNSDNGEDLIEEICRALSDAYQWPHFLPEIKKYYRLDPSTYKLYEGTYEVNPDYRLKVTHEDYYLIIQPTGQAATRFFVENATTFFSTDPYIRIRFTLDEEGNVTGLVLRQREFKREAEKIE